MAYVNARRLAERLSIIEAMRMVLLIGQPANYTGNNEIVVMLNRVIADTMPFGTDREKAKHYARARSVTKDLMAIEFLQEKASVTKFAMAVYHFLDNLLVQGLFSVEQGSDLEHAFEQILFRLSDFTGVEMNKFDLEAFEAAQRMLLRLQAGGYYQELEWVTVFQPAG